MTHIYQLSFEDGGITIDQFLSLLNTHVKKEIENKKFLAQIITGINFDEKETKEEASVGPQQSQEFMSFGDPEQYKNMSEEQKKELTQKMKQQHHMWSSHKLSRSRAIGS